MATDQKQFWNKRHEHASPQHVLANGEVTAFALEVLGVIPPKSAILEIGCGVGNDSLFFASKGHTVLSTDLSEVAIEKNKVRNDLDNVEFQVLDVSAPTPYEDKKFDVIYARLSLHYFSDTVTKQIFKEFARILKHGGYLCFICKSVDDSSYGKGIALERDMFEDNGHVRHFFSEAYAKECLGKDFVEVILEKGEEHFYTRDAAYVKVIAKRI